MSLKDNAFAAGTGALVFLILSSPWVYDKTNMLTEKVGSSTWDNNCPTAFGRILHTLVFVLAVYLILVGRKLALKESLDIPKLWKISFVSGLLYFFLSSGAMFHLTNQLAGKVGQELGVKHELLTCPNNKGLVLHAIVFGLVLFGWMFLPDA